MNKNMENSEHLLHETVVRLSSVLSQRLLQIRSKTDRYRRSFLPTAISINLRLTVLHERDLTQPIMTDRRDGLNFPLFLSALLQLCIHNVPSLVYWGLGGKQIGFYLSL
ncbi:hypothetical protein GOODEAATRI_034444 [Goodea atripinnis]|uniref:Uncharacterized protein n=1 Tax=Goodea atripinnis TaxID=208336 RepID=A0ABV0P9Z0_9TELE